jgi:hypothetical protein
VVVVAVGSHGIGGLVGMHAMTSTGRHEPAYSPGKVLGRGAAGEGVGHWWLQRVTAVALLPLSCGLSLRCCRIR